MFYNLLYPLADVFSPFNIFRYLTFRSIAAFLTALVLSFLIGGGLIRWLRSKQAQGQPIRNDGPATHLTKKGTPTMGGLLILITLTVASLLWADLTNRYVWIVLAITLAFGAVGFWDDFLKVTKKNPKGVPGKIKLAISIVVAAIAAYLIAQASPSPLRYMMALPFLKDVLLPLGLLGFLAFSTLVMVGASNAVNLTDGLDGLATGLAGISAAAFAGFAYLFGRVDATTYLNLFYLPGAGELAVFCGALMGATIGFLWFNAHPAQVFMGDTGSLAIGGALGTVAILLKAEFLLLVIGGVFAAEAISVLIQTGTYKWHKRTRGKEYADAHRVFRMAPLHHHFEKLGWAETTVVTRFYILGLMCALVALSTLKVR